MADADPVVAAPAIPAIPDFPGGRRVLGPVKSAFGTDGYCAFSFNPGVAVPAPPAGWEQWANGRISDGSSLLVIRPAKKPDLHEAVQLPQMTPHKATPNANARGDGLRVQPNETSITHVLVDGFEQNIVVENHPAATTLSDVFSMNARPQNPEQQGTFKGQGMYLNKCGPILISGYYARSNGWQVNMAPAKRDRFRHHIYSNFDVESLTVEDAWLDDAACAGIQSRGKACTIRRCFITGNGINLLLTGAATIESCTIYNGHCYHFPADPATNHPASWAGDNAIQNYYPITLRDVWIVGQPNQGADVTSIPGLRTFHLGAVVSGGDYSKPEWKPPIGPDGKRITKLVTATDCHIVGWPGPAFAGAARHDGSGFTIHGSAVDVKSAIDKIRADMETRTISIRDAVAKAQTAVRDAARATF